jgi:FixJ family two-component response regulator
VEIAVIDDDASVRRALASLVASLGHAVATFASAEAFLDSGRTGATACVITDVQMPGMTGIDLLRRLPVLGLDIPVILVTAWPQPAMRDRLLRDGAVAYLAKPLQEDRLVACLEQAIAGRD